MKIRRFFAPDMRRAIQLVRAEHGADAVILSSRAVDGGMEIISAVDYDEELIAQMIQPGSRPRQDAAVDATAARTVDATGRTADATAGTTADAASRTVDAAASTVATAAASDTPAAPADTAHWRGRTSRAAIVDRPSATSTTASGSSTRSGGRIAGLPPAHPEAPHRTSRKSPTRETHGAAADETVAASAREGVKHACRADDVAVVRAGDDRTTPCGEDPSIVALRNELIAMRSMLCRQLAQIRWADRRMLEPERALLASRVARLGLDPDLAETLVAEVDDPAHARAWREVMYGLARRLDVPKEDPLDSGGVFALVGPTGVGKTTTIAKLAARHCLRYGRESLALISTDTFRIGAQRQLDAYGAILGVPVRQAGGAAELKRLLSALSDRRLVLIDTAGLSSRDRRLTDALASLDVDRRVRRLVVLAATMQQSVMDEAVTAFGGDAVGGVVLTKLDEADGLGPALSVLIRRKLTATWLSHGQRVPEDLRLARIIHLLRWALDEERFARPDDSPDVAALGVRVPAAEVMHAGL